MKSVAVVSFICVFFGGVFPVTSSELADILAGGTPEEVESILTEAQESMIRDAFRWTPLMLAAAENPNPEVITLLLDSGEDLDARSLDDWDALCFAAAFNSRAGVVRVLLEAGADPNHRTRDAWATRYGAARFTGETVTVNQLVPRPEVASVDPDRVEPGWTPLFFAAFYNGNPEIASELLAGGADPTLRDENGKSALDYARAAGPRRRAVREFLENFVLDD